LQLHRYENWQPYFCPPKFRPTAKTRLLHELNSLLAEPPVGCSARPKDRDLTEWRGFIEGPAGSPYEGGVFEVVIVFGADYPFHAPRFSFVTTVWHPCIRLVDGDVSDDILGSAWSPAHDVRRLLMHFSALLANPATGFWVNKEAYTQFTTQPAEFRLKAREYTVLYAQKETM
jgi:ubiquitin-protein ligase